MVKIPFMLKLNHELKTLAHGIGGVSKYLNDNWDNLDEKTRKQTTLSIFSASQGVSKIVEEMSKYTSLAANGDFKLNLMETEILDITEAAVLMCQNLSISKPDILIAFKNDLGKCKVKLDPFWYKQVLINLIFNAVNYSNKGEVLVRLQKKYLHNKAYCLISVKDEGIGIIEKELEQIFEPFNRGSTADMYSMGSGLGLSICQEIVEKHKGRITASKNKSVGITVEFMLPIE